MSQKTIPAQHCSDFWTSHNGEATAQRPRLDGTLVAVVLVSRTSATHVHRRPGVSTIAALSCLCNSSCRHVPSPTWRIGNCKLSCQLDHPSLKFLVSWVCRQSSLLAATKLQFQAASANRHWSYKSCIGVKSTPTPNLPKISSPASQAIHAPTPSSSGKIIQQLTRLGSIVG